MSQHSAAKQSSGHNSSSGCTYRFINSSLATLSPNICRDLEIRQQPVQAKVSIVNERDRRPIEPPPILQLHWSGCTDDELKKCLQSPFYYVVANLVTEDKPGIPLLPAEKYLSGSPVSSLHRLRDIDNSEGGYFVFGDLAVKQEGKFKLRFSLFEIIEGEVRNCRTLLSDTFTVYVPKHYPGPVEATFLSRTFSDQGVKMRIRKEHRIQRKRKHDNDATSSSSSTTWSETNSHHPNKKSPSSTSSRRSTISSHISSVSSEVHFGRWQARPSPTTNNNSKTRQQDQPSVTSTFNLHSRQGTLSPPALQQHYDHQSRSLTEYSKPSIIKSTNDYHFKKTSAQPSRQVTLPGPESVIYSHIHTSTNTSTYSKSLAYDALTETPQSLSTHHIHCSSARCQLPRDRSLARYHICNDRHMKSSENMLPRPPMSITDLHLHATGTQSWGTCLPPLRAIMTDDSNTHPLNPTTAKTSHTTSLTATSLLLPLPPALLTLGSSANHAYQ